MSHLVGSHMETLHRASASDIKSPQAHFKKAPVSSENPTIPSPGCFTDLDDLPHDHLPTAAQCAVHLELLECFHALRTNVIGSTQLDKTFSLEPNIKTVYRRKYVRRLRKSVNQPVKIMDTTWRQRRDEKWPRFLDFAADRFVTWADKIDGAMGSDSSLPYMPPIDVLMFWHAFLLNPADWNRYCRRKSLNHLIAVPFPWKQIHTCINSQGPISQTWSYNLSEQSQSWLTTAGIQPILHDHLVSLGTVNISRPQGQPAFTASLIGNVTRQSVFVDKMHSHLWIRSPALAGTVSRCISRYDNFLELFALYPGRILVPTLDIDLAWHTHQLSAQEYKTTMESRCGRFINHDDKLGKGTLDDGLKETREVYRVRFGDAYSICLCWDCEAVVSALEVCDEEGELGEKDSREMAKRVTQGVLRDVQYYRAVEAARRRGETLLPVR
ncbi:hypothetical protein ACJ41O_000859 [Fusarium nematophilum]